MDQHFRDSIWDGDITLEDAIGQRVRLDIDDAQFVIETFGTMGTKAVFHHLDRIATDDHPALSKIILKRMEEQTALVFDSPASDETYRSNAHSRTSDERTMSDFLISHGHMDRLIQNRYVIANPTSQFVLRMAELGFHQQALAHLSAVSQEDFQQFIQHFDTPGAYSSLYSAICSSISSQETVNASYEDILTVLTSPHRTGYLEHEDAQMVVYLTDHLHEAKAVSHEDVAVAMLEHTAMRTRLFTNPPFHFSDPDRVIEAIGKHSNAGSIVREMLASYNSEVYELELPFYMHFAHALAGYNLNTETIAIVREATQGKDLTGLDLESLSRDDVVLILGEEAYEQINLSVLKDHTYRALPTLERTMTEGSPLLSVPRRSQEIHESHDYLSVPSIAIIAVLETGPYIPFTFSAMGVTKSGKEGFAQFEEVIAHIEHSLDEGRYPDVPFYNESREYHYVIEEVVNHHISRRMQEYTEIRGRLGSLDPESKEYKEIASIADRQFHVIDRMAVAIAVAAAENEKSPGRELAKFTQIAKSKGFPTGTMFIPSAFNPIGQHFDGYPEAIIDAVIDFKLTGNISPELAELGIIKTGDAGYTQLVARIDAHRNDILFGRINQDLAKNSLYQGLFSHVIRSHESQYSARADLANMLYQEQGQGLGHPAIVHPRARGESSLETTDQLRGIYNSLIDDIHSAQSIVDEEGTISIEGLQKVFERLEAITQTQIGNLRKQLEHLDPSKAERIAKIKLQIDQLSDITSESMWQIGNLFPRIELLSEFKEFKRPLRELLMVSAMSQQVGYRTQSFQRVEEGNISLAQAAALTDFIDHAVFHETWKKLFEEHSKLGTLKHLVQAQDLTTFQKAILQQSEGGARTSFTLVPVRGPLVEASGSIADACWQNRYGSVSEEFPQISAVMIVKNSNAPLQSRFAGACLLIEANAADGTPLLIIRGLNPLQNDITQLQQDSFFFEFARFADGLAKQHKRELAVVIDDHSGGSATNRPTLYEFMDSMRDDMERIELSDDVETTFNGYDISGCTYRVNLKELAVRLEQSTTPALSSRHSGRHSAGSSGAYRPSTTSAAPQSVQPREPVLDF